MQKQTTDVLYGSETQKALTNFNISDIKMPRPFLSALGLLKSACAAANAELGLLDDDKAGAIQQAAEEVAQGLHDQQFPIDIYQTGSGTSTNMNANEVISALVNLKSLGNISVHPNDDVNKSQSSNDIIPSCIHVSAAKLITEELLPALSHLITILDEKAAKHHHSIKTGRTHLMDAMPISFAQEISGWRAQVDFVKVQLQHSLDSLLQLAIGGTAVGTGINCPPQFANIVCKVLSQQTALTFIPAENYFRAISAQDTAAHVSGILKTYAVSLSKITNDIRWMSSGPLNGLNEVTLPERQKGSSIMPGKVNPVIPEAVLMACTQVIGNDTTIALAAQSGNFQLNTMLPLVAHNLLQNIQLLTSCSKALADNIIADMQINQERIQQNVERNPMLATALNNLIGYDKSAEIAKKAYLENRTVLDVAKEMTDIDETELIAALDPKSLIGHR
ncbi:class II fumarate hydratase [Alteromonadaceae bacterium BrNp21-10]|nr:class II fumarate hydratase [Alteromonadaceae bacterium BrNp21-10]